MSARLKNFHVPLSDDLYARLRQEAERSGKPATEVAREAIEDTLKERAARQLHASIAAYAAAAAGTKDDLDPDLESAAIQHLAKARKRRR
jgi:predicted transcriptional regulator